jgi:subtilisin family serine protease
VAEAITIGATTSTDAKASYSNYGACVDFFAPGSSITSANYANNTGSSVKSGTSMAAPHVAGVAAQYLQSNPAATPQQVRDALVANSTPGKVTSAGTGSPNRLLFSAY